MAAGKQSSRLHSVEWIVMIMSRKAVVCVVNLDVLKQPFKKADVWKWEVDVL